jgi:Ca2+/H+ antiporter
MKAYIFKAGFEKSGSRRRKWQFLDITATMVTTATMVIMATMVITVTMATRQVARDHQCSARHWL